MASASSSTPFFGVGDVVDEHQIQEMRLQPQSSSVSEAVEQTTAAKKIRRSSYPEDAEVIALSPRSLLATNRFPCEVCGKGFQREQNLQLHRRGHNLPWKLRQKGGDAAGQRRRRVYVCPEPACAHHHPSRALGDLTGVKKHFCRKHGEKRWKCDRCAKSYAVQSDWKAHAKTCGTREYRCHCGTLFSRRDSFVTHRAFCDALAQENAWLPTGLAADGNGSIQCDASGGGGGSIVIGRPGSLPLEPVIIPQSKPSPTIQASLVHLPDLQGSATAALPSCSAASAPEAPNLFNFGFLSTNNGGQPTIPAPVCNMLSDSRNPLDEQLSAGVVPAQQMPAAALLQKAATSSLLGGFANAASPRKAASFPTSFGGSYGTQLAGNDAHIQYLMSSLASGGADIGLFSGSTLALECHGEGRRGFDMFNIGNMCYDMEEAKYNMSNSGSLGGGSEGLTRDFLGVGSMVSMAAGIEGGGNIDMSLLDPDVGLGSSSRSYFVGGGLQ